MVHLGRQPKPKDLIGRILFSLGGAMRGLGTALDTVGVAVQGPYANVDHCEYVGGCGQHVMYVCGLERVCEMQLAWQCTDRMHLWSL